VIFLGLGAAILAIVVALSSKQVQVALDLSSANTGTDKAQEKVPYFVQIPDRAKHADLVISGKVLSSSASMETNDYGDKLIVTHQKVQVAEWLKGSSNSTIDMDIIGGTLNGTTLTVSDQPEPLETGDQAIMFLSQQDNGHFNVAQAGLTGSDIGASEGIMKLNANGQTEEGNLTSAQVKAQLGGVK
jgi:hypothetical protein